VIFAGENFVSLAIITSDTDFYNLYFFILNINLYFIKIYVNGDWKLRNVASNIEEKRIEMIVVNVKKEKKENRNSTSDIEE
jgi:hypothetical protein